MTIDYDIFIESEYIRGFEVKYTYLNMKKDLPLNYNKVITKTEDNIKGVQMFFDHTKEILCSNIEEEYSVVKKILASSCAMFNFYIFCIILYNNK